MPHSTNGAVVERGVVASCNASANARSACAWTSDVRAANATGPTRGEDQCPAIARQTGDRKSTRLNSSHGYISYAVFCLKKKKKKLINIGKQLQGIFSAHNTPESAN